MQLHRMPGRLCATGMIAGVAALAAAAPAAAVDGQPDGIWSPFDRCPLEHPLFDDPAGFSAICGASITPRNSGGHFRIRGSVTPITGASNVQFAVAGITDAEGEQHMRTASRSNPLVAEPNRVPGGLLGIATESALKRLTLLVPGSGRLINAVNDVTATMQSAGPASDFNLFGALGEGKIMTLPVKLKLSHPLLGGNCYIGSNSNPIVLRLAVGATEPPPPNKPITGHPGTLEYAEDPDAPEGSGAGVISALGATVVDNEFAVPAARGCGPLNLLDSAINQRMGLPSPAGNNELVLKGTNSYLGGSERSGDLSAAEVLQAEIAEG